MKLLSPFVIVDERKLQFAEGLLKNPYDAFKVALEIFGLDTNGAFRASMEWVSDPVVIEHQRLLKEEKGEFAFLPTKADLAREALETHKILKKTDPAAAAKYFDMHLKIMDYYPKETGNIVNIQNNVMLVPDHGSDENWEKRALEQQNQLREKVVASVRST